MSEKRTSNRSLFGKIKDVSWWAYYSLFLLTILFLLSLIIRSLLGGASGGISNFGQLIYLVGLCMAVFGLMGLCIAYLVRVMWDRLKVHRGGETQKGWSDS